MTEIQDALHARAAPNDTVKKYHGKNELIQAMLVGIYSVSFMFYYPFEQTLHA